MGKEKELLMWKRAVERLAQVQVYVDRWRVAMEPLKRVVEVRRGK